MKHINGSTSLEALQKIHWPQLRNGQSTQTLQNSIKYYAIEQFLFLAVFVLLVLRFIFRLSIVNILSICLYYDARQIH